MKQPKVACCIASYNMARFLPELLDSLRNQTYKNIAIYVSYHGSSDNTKEILKKYKEVKIIPYKKKPGIGLNKHDAVKEALKDKKNKYLLMFDADDYVLPTYVEKAVERLERGDVDWVLVWGRLFGDRQGYIHSEIESLEELRKANNHRHSWISAKASLFRKMNYNTEITYAEDWDLWIRLDEAGYKGGIVEEELYMKRWHEQSLTAVTLRQSAPTSITKTNKFMGIKRFVFHIPGYVHLPSSLHYIGCAFTCKAIRLAKMLTELGHTVFYYGAKSTHGENVKDYCNSSNLHFVETHSVKDIAQQWGNGDNRFELGYDYKGGQFRHDFNSAKTELTKRFYNTCIQEINKRKNDNEFILLMQGQYHKPISDVVHLALTCEPGIGYRGSIKGGWRAFESAYLQNFTYGSERPFESINGSHYDRVIPNYFDKKDFIYSAKKKDYYLYIGRMIDRKGVRIAIQATEAIGAKLILAGQQDDEINVKTLPKHCEFVGFADIEKRKKLMSEAIAVFVPTIYLEAFGGTHIEAMLSGTPTITTNFGVFSGTIPDIIDGNFHMTSLSKAVGFKCNTLQDFVDAAIKAKSVDHRSVRQYAERFLMDNVKHEFQKWFRDLYNWYESSVDDSKKGWSRLEKK